MKQNIGKTAYHVKDGTEVGRITGVDEGHYVVMREGRRVLWPSDRVTVGDTPPSVSAAPTPTPKSESIDPAAVQTAAEFNRRLGRYSGNLQEMTLSNGQLNARWISGECDLFRGEVIDLLISIHRTQTASPSISGRRTCRGGNKTYELSGADFQRYRTGQINDPDVLRGIKH